jgi:hypothetical protein
MLFVIVVASELLSAVSLEMNWAVADELDGAIQFAAVELEDGFIQFADEVDELLPPNRAAAMDEIDETEDISGLNHQDSAPWRTLMEPKRKQTMSSVGATARSGKTSARGNKKYH